VVALTGYRNVAHVRPGVRLIRFRTLFVNNSYRWYAVCRTTSVVAYVRQTIVNSHPGVETKSLTSLLARDHITEASFSYFEKSFSVLSQSLSEQ